MPQTIKIDHVTIAGPDLQELEKAFANVSLPTLYGGPHSNDITHMSSLSFQDGSYIELISTLKPHQVSPWWHDHIEGNAGPCAWAIEVPDVSAEAERIGKLGITVRGPKYMTRTRPDGRIVKWNLAFVGDGEPGTKLPFIIRDRTPREYRVPHVARLADSSLEGIAAVVLGVKNMDASVALFRSVYALGEPSTERNLDLDAELTWFEGTPIVLATPRSPNDWLDQRLSRFGECPCAYLIRTDNLSKASQIFDLTHMDRWFVDWRVGWLKFEGFAGIGLGMIGDVARASRS